MPNKPAHPAPKKWFAFLDTERFIYLGEHASFHDASDAAENENVPGGSFQGNVAWILPEENMRDLMASAQAAIAQAAPEKVRQEKVYWSRENRSKSSSLGLTHPTINGAAQ